MSVELEEKPVGQAEELEEGAVLEPKGGEGEGEGAAKKPETDEMRKAIADLAGTVRELATPKEEKKELSQAEVDELWQVYDPKKTKADFMRKFFRLNPEATDAEEKEASDLFYEMRDGLVRQAVTGSRHFLAIELDKMAKKFEPILKYVDERQTADLRDRFFKSYEGLADPKYKKVIDAQAKILKASGTEFKNEDEYFKALADGAADAIKELVPDFDLGKKPEKKPAATTQKLPRTTVGGGSSAGGSQVKATPANGNIDELDD